MAIDAEGWEEGTVFLKSTDKNGGVSFTEHRCWNVSKFLQGAFRRALEVKGACEQITFDQFRAATQRDNLTRRAS